jgi:hypothetical protein
MRLMGRKRLLTLITYRIKLMELWRLLGWIL